MRKDVDRILDLRKIFITKEKHLKIYLRGSKRMQWSEYFIQENDLTSKCQNKAQIKTLDLHSLMLTTQGRLDNILINKKKIAH